MGQRQNHISLEIVRRGIHAKGFEVLPRSWGVERTFARILNNPRLVRDYEQLTDVAETLIIIPASVTLLHRWPRIKTLLKHALNADAVRRMRSDAVPGGLMRCFPVPASPPGSGVNRHSPDLLLHRRDAGIGRAPVMAATFPARPVSRPEARMASLGLLWRFHAKAHEER